MYLSSIIYLISVECKIYIYLAWEEHAAYGIKLMKLYDACYI